MSFIVQVSAFREIRGTGTAIGIAINIALVIAALVIALIPKA